MNTENLLTAQTLNHSTSKTPRSIQRSPLPLSLDAILCLSHLRWDFVYQRPQHLMTRFARQIPVYYMEEPVGTTETFATLEIQERSENLYIAVPRIPLTTPRSMWPSIQAGLLDDLVNNENLERYALWFYTPMAIEFTQTLSPVATVYDCMDELTNFKNAPIELRRNEEALFSKADVVFTGGRSLYEVKKNKHPNVHAFPSSVDVKHFRSARNLSAAPSDQALISGPKIGFFGVIDERMDLKLVDKVARLRPQWNFIFLGPIVKIDPTELPRLPNVHYLGQKAYTELPSYLACWDVAILPFARNEATRFISPTKTPEYLAAGCPVVSTSIRDVVDPYLGLGLVRIADEPIDFVREIELSLSTRTQSWLDRVDSFLVRNSWDTTWSEMKALLHDSCSRPLTFNRRKA